MTGHAARSGGCRSLSLSLSSSQRAALRAWGGSARGGGGRGAQKKKDLTAAEGHVLLLEYLEEAPLLLARPGMGARLTTYYRKRGALDAGHQRLAQAAPRWRVGQARAAASPCAAPRTRARGRPATRPGLPPHGGGPRGSAERCAAPAGRAGGAHRPLASRAQRGVGRDLMHPPPPAPGSPTCQGI